jgi:hypothetical protein
VCGETSVLKGIRVVRVSEDPREMKGCADRRVPEDRWEKKGIRVRRVLKVPLVRKAHGEQRVLWELPVLRECRVL